MANQEGMELGWIKLWRKIMLNWVWQDKPFAKGQAWIDLLLLANFKDGKKLINSRVISIQRGQLLTSERKLAKRWGWSRTKVKTFLEELVTDNMINK